MLAALPFGIALVLVSQALGQPFQRLTQNRSAANTKIPSNSDQNQKSAEQQAIEAIRELLTQESRIQQQNADERESEKSEANQNVTTQRQLAKYTRGLFWVGFLQGAALLITAVILYKQVVTGRSAERAWLKPAPRFNKLDQPPPNGAATILYVCSLKNTGRTPARIVQTGLAFRRIDKLEHLPKEPTYLEQEILDAGRSLLVPGDEFAVSTLAQQPMTTAEYVTLRNRQVFMYSYGFVKYLDVFGKSREFRFVHYYHVPVPGEPQVEGFQRLVSAPSEYNKAT
jgi:hypothetical protein